MLQYNFQPVKSRSVQVTSYVRFPCRRPVCFHKCGQLRSQLFYWSKCVCACAKMWHTAKTPSYQDGQCWWFLLGAPIFGQTTEGHSPEPLLPGDFSEPAERLDLDLSHALSIWRQLEVDFSPMFCFTCRCLLGNLWETSNRQRTHKQPNQLTQLNQPIFSYFPLPVLPQKQACLKTWDPKPGWTWSIGAGPGSGARSRTGSWCPTHPLGMGWSIAVGWRWHTKNGLILQKSRNIIEMYWHVLHDGDRMW